MLEKNGNGQLWLPELLVNNVYFTMDQGDGSLTHGIWLVPVRCFGFVLFGNMDFTKFSIP